MEGDSDKRDLTGWFNFMDEQLKKLKQSNETNIINNILIDNDIETID